MARRPLKPEDLMHGEIPEMVAIHPDGLYYIHHTMDAEHNRSGHVIFAIDFDGLRWSLGV